MDTRKSAWRQGVQPHPRFLPPPSGGHRVPSHRLVPSACPTTAGPDDPSCPVTSPETPDRPHPSVSGTAKAGAGQYPTVATGTLGARGVDIVRIHSRPPCWPAGNSPGPTVCSSGRTSNSKSPPGLLSSKPPPSPPWCLCFHSDRRPSFSPVHPPPIGVLVWVSSLCALRCILPGHVRFSPRQAMPAPTSAECARQHLALSRGGVAPAFS